MGLSIFYIFLTLPNSEELSNCLRYQLQFVEAAVFLRTSTSNTSTFYGRNTEQILYK